MVQNMDYCSYGFVCTWKEGGSTVGSGVFIFEINAHEINLAIGVIQIFYLLAGSLYILSIVERGILTAPMTIVELSNSTCTFISFLSCFAVYNHT